MKPSDDLFMLIKSLSKSEKGYFKKFARVNSLNTNAYYLVLFDAIDKLKAYDEIALIKSLAGHPVVSQLSVAKNYLYHLLLKCLRNYRASISIDSRLKDDFRNIEILFEKGLFHQCKKILKRAKHTAKQYEYHYHLLEAIRWEGRIMMLENDFSKLDNLIKTDLESAGQSVAQLNEMNKYLHTAFQAIFAYKRGGTLRSREDSTAIEIRDIGLRLSKDADIGSYHARNYYLQTFYFYYLTLGEFDKAYRYCLDMLVHMEDNMTMVQEEPSQYLGILQNAMAICIFLDKYEDVKEFADKKILAIRQLPKHKYRFMQSRMVDAYNSKLFACTALADIAEGELVLKEMEPYAVSENIQQETLLIYRYTCARFQILKGQYRIAQHYLSAILNEPEPAIRRDYYSFAKLLSLIVHYELHHNRLLESMVVSVYRYLRGRKRLFRVEELVLRFFRNIRAVRNKDEQMKLLANLKTELEKLESDEYERKAFKYFDFLAWLDSKLQEEDLVDVIKAKVIPRA